MPSAVDVELSHPLSLPHPMTSLRKTAVTGACQACGQTTNYVCSACLTDAHYCGPRHIIEDWDHHSMQCNGDAIITAHRAMQYSLAVNADPAYDPADFDPSVYDTSACDDILNGYVWGSVADTPRTVRGLYADPDSENINFVDVPVIPRDIGNREFGHGWGALLVEYMEDPAARTIISFDEDLEPLPAPLAIYFSVDEYLRGRRVNSSVAALAHNCEPQPRPWYGPLVVVKVLDDPVSDFGDVEVSDLDTVRAFFTHV